MSQPTRPGSGPRLQIVDQGGLSAVIDYLIDHFGTQQEVARRLDIDQSTVSNLRRGKHKSMSLATYDRIRRGFMSTWPWAAPNDGKMELEEARNASKARKAKQAKQVRKAEESEESEEGKESEEAEMRRVGKLFGLHETLQECVVTSDQALILKAYRQWLREELDRHDWQFVEELFQHEECRRYILEFVEDVKNMKTGHVAHREDRAKRMQLALVRAIRPLSHSARTMGVEEGWQELHQRGCLRDYLRAALEAERILLEQTADLLTRVQGLRAVEEEEAYYESLAPTPEEIAEWERETKIEAPEGEPSEGRDAGPP